jgi:predicted GNAT superfamily acetyltransferase
MSEASSNMNDKTPYVVRDYRPEDSIAILELNAAHVPEVSTMDTDQLAFFVHYAPYFKVVEAQGEVTGILIGITDAEQEYESSNYGWFLDRHDSFAYVDRIALAESVRGIKLGPELYADFANWARKHDKAYLCAEVNTYPPNPRSLRFHNLSGFIEVGRRKPYGPDEEVAMLEKAL